MRQDRNWLSGQLEDFIPPEVRKLLGRLEAERNFKRIALVGFSEAMKWMYRLMREEGREPLLLDWRERFVGYDCAGGTVGAIAKFKNDPETLFVLCPQDQDVLRDGVRFLIDQGYDKSPAIYDLTEPHFPFLRESPYKGIAQRARARAISVISDEKLFNLIQYVEQTSHLDGGVVEFGSFNGGSSAVIIEAVNHFRKKPVLVFDSYEGIPKSRYGLDHRWHMAFSNNSYSEVSAAFRDCDNVLVIKGNIVKTISEVKGPVAFCHVAIDTMEAGELALQTIWPMLQPEGIITVDDYGSYPNCVPLTVFTDRFCEGRTDVFKFQTELTGVFLMKRKP